MFKTMKHQFDSYPKTYLGSFALGMFGAYLVLLYKNIILEEDVDRLELELKWERDAKWKYFHRWNEMVSETQD